MASVDPNVNYDQVMLEKLEYGIQQRLMPIMAQSLSLEAWRSQFTDDMTFSLRALILAEKLAENTQTISGTAKGLYFEPSSTWQMFKRQHKDSWWLRWYVKRWKVQTESIKVDTRWSRKVKTQQFATFPAAPIMTPEKFRGPIVVRAEQSVVY